MAYVPYDTSILTGFSNVIKGYIGSSVSLGFVVFAVILGVLIVTMIVKHFSKVI